MSRESSHALYLVALTDRPEGEAADDYVSYGYVDPHEADRLFTELQRQHVRFQFEDASRLVPIRSGVRLARSNALKLFVHRDDMKATNRVIRESLSR